MSETARFLMSWLNGELPMGAHDCFMARDAVLDIRNQKQMFTGSGAVRLNNVVFVNESPRTEAVAALSELLSLASRAGWRAIKLPNTAMIDVRSQFSGGIIPDRAALVSLRKSLGGYVRYAPKLHDDLMITALRIRNATHHRGSATHAVLGMTSPASEADFFTNPDDATEAYLRGSKLRLVEL